MKAVDSCKSIMVLACLLGAALPAWPQGATPPWATLQGRPPLPAVPHEQSPDKWPQPDYFAEALRLTGFTPSERSTSPAVRPPGGAQSHRYLVLPVQTQAFGFGPGFRALVGARLDHELATRGIDGNRQTEVFDAYGPWVRRWDDVTADALAKRQRPAGGTLALYLGHDGRDTGFVTLLLKDATGAVSWRGHRSVTLANPVEKSLASVDTAVEALLQDAGFAGPTAQAGRSTGAACRSDAWQLEPLGTAATSMDRACQALVVGTLMPRLGPPSSRSPNPDLPGRLVWLATAYVEAAAGSTPGPSELAVRELAWVQLMEAHGLKAASPHVNDADPVIGPLARMLSAPALSQRQPVRSGRDATASIVERTGAGLPPFAKAIFIERGNFDDALRAVDLCAIEHQYPGMMVTAKCRASKANAAPPAGRATELQATLYQHWRIASFHKDIAYLGRALGDRQRLAALLSGLPEDLARHPLIQQQRFAVEDLHRATVDGFDAYLASVRAAIRSFVQSTADLQRNDTVQDEHALFTRRWTENTNILRDPDIGRAQNDEHRMRVVLAFDRFSSATSVTERREVGAPAIFLAPGPVTMAHMQAAMAPQRSPSGVPLSPQPPVQQTVSDPPIFLPGLTPPPATAEVLKNRIAAKPGDMMARVQQAMLILKEGAPPSQARALIDAQPTSSRSDEQIEESHTWAIPAHAYFFASDIDGARDYYERVRKTGTYSESDLHARVRLRLIENDIPGALAATETRLRRYESDFARRDLAAFLFMRSQPDQAWAWVLPRLASATTFQLWVGAFVGHRMEARPLPAVKEWLVGRGLEGAQIQSKEVIPMYLHFHAVTDRRPTDADVELLRGGKPHPMGDALWPNSAMLTQMALADSYPRERFDRIRQSLQLPLPGQNAFMRPLFTWAAWHATANQDPELGKVRRITLQSEDFDALLSKSMLLALDGQVAASLDFLRAARFQMSELGLGLNNVDRAVPSSYHYALAGYLMFRKTGSDAYRVETLRFVKAYEKVFPFFGWTHAMEGLLERDAKSRLAALCRAKHLDPGSYFLGLAGPPAQVTACAKAPW